jgi:hypothetical protein
LNLKSDTITSFLERLHIQKDRGEGRGDGDNLIYILEIFFHVVDG